MVLELEWHFPSLSDIEKEADKKAFAKLFGEYLCVENVLQNYVSLPASRPAKREYGRLCYG